ncbi:unnamed protein product [Paramecium sonneborni]|uniref:Transmembrane protein n=1 Tax=Paramecium sonneborni TaxID=65129 RepID=A0A8S1RG30_9CILI|nr:unnamed protein product [Paramecium sonneborni]
MNSLFMITYYVTFTIAELISIQKAILLENEKVFSLNQIIVFPLNNYQNIQYLDSIEFPLIELKDTIIIRNQFSITNIQSIIINDNDQLAIMTINNNEMICIIQINTYLIDGELSYQNCTINFKFQLENCSQVYQISNNRLIILCFQHSKIMTLLLQNFQNQVINKYELEVSEQTLNCKYHLINQDENIIIYQTNCNMTLIHIFKIQNEDIKLYYNNSIQSLLQLEQNEFKELGQLISIQICVFTNLIIQFQYNKFLCKNMILDCIYIYKENQTFKKTIKTFDFCQKSQNLQRTNEGYWLFKNRLLNVVIDGYEDSILVNNKLIIYSKQELQIFFSQKFSNKWQIQIQAIIPVGDLHYFALLNIQGELQIYKLVNEQFYFSNFNSTSNYIVKRQIYDFYQTEGNYTVIKIEEYDQNNPPFLINNQKINFKIRNLQNKLCFYINQIQESIPFEITNIKIDERNVKYQYQTQGFSCKYNNNILYKNLWLIEDKDQRQILILENSQKINIYICFQGLLINRFIIPIHINYVKTVTSSEYLSFCIIYPKEFQFYQFNDLSLSHKSISIKEKINKTLIYKNEIILILDNCKLIQLKFNDFKSTLINLDINYHICSEIQYIVNLNHVITFDSIIQFRDGKIITMLKQPHKILQVGNIMYFVIFSQNQENIDISLYYSYLNESTKLYNLPLYEFQIKFPINYDYQELFLLVLAQNKQENDFLLIYNCSSTSIKSLVQIIRIDKDHQFFGFINSKFDFFFIQNGSIVIQNINQICLQFEHYPYYTHNHFISQFTYDLTLKPSLKKLKQLEQIKFTQKFINMNQSLFLLKDDFVKIDSYGYIELINIYGKINEIEVLEKDQFIIIPPFTLFQTNDKIYCLLYKNNLCIQFDFTFHQIYFNITQQFQIAISLDNHCKIFFDQMLEAYLIIEIVGNLIEKKMKILKLQFDKMNAGNESFNQIKETTSLIEIQNIGIIEVLNIKGLIIIVNDLFERFLIFLQYDKLIELKLYSIYFTLDGYFIRNGTYLFIAANNFQLELVIHSYNYQNQQMKQTTLFYFQLNISQMLLDYYSNDFTLELKYIKITFADINLNLLQVKAFLFFTEFFAFSIELHFDIMKQILQKSYISSIFRYIESSKFETLLYLDEYFMVIKVLDKSKPLLIFYELSLILQKTYHDSIYQVKDQNYTLIEKHNLTHHVIIQFENDALQINFIQLSKYQIKQIKECNSSPTLLLQNDINNLIVQTMIFDQKSTFNFQGIVVFFCFIFILLYTKRKNN